MKKRLYFLLAILLGLFACRKPVSSVSTLVDPNFVKAKSFFPGQPDSAYYYFNKVVTNAKDSLQTARSYNYMALIQSDAGDYFGAQECLTLALKFLSPGKGADQKCLSSTYNELGLTSLSLKNQGLAINYFDQAIKYAPDKNYKQVFLNNKALAYQEKGDYARALNLYQAIISDAGNPETYSRLLTNIATTKWLRDPDYNAAPELLKALHIRQQEKDSWGQNSSYAHLADYYATRRPDSALFYAEKMYTTASKLNSPDDESQALKKLIEIGPLKDTRVYFKRYRRLNDSLQTARNSAKNQFALIRYEVEKNKADNLKLQKDNTEKRYQLVRQSIRFYCSLAGFLLLIGGAVLWYQKRKRLQQQEKEDAVMATQRMASKKVHDTLANDIYRIMKKVQHDPEINKEWLLDNIDDVYKRSRDISYDIVQNADDHFHEYISALLKSFATEQTQVILAGNDAGFWQKIDPVSKFELRCILQELMVNMQKHSRATKVVVRFEEKNSVWQITYFDNGIGLGQDHVQKNGLQNTGNRINAIGGQITFGNDSGEGLQIQITFPAVN